MNLPKIKLGKYDVSRVICGGNPITGFSHLNDALDIEMKKYYTVANVHKLLAECENNGINTVQFRGDRFYLRIMLEHFEAGGKMQWICQTASEMRDLKANVREIKAHNPIAIYFHGTEMDNLYHAGKIEQARDIIKFAKDNGMLVGAGSHMPEVIEKMEEERWETDFYMCCLYNLARKPKTEQATKTKNEEECFEEGDPDIMTEVIRKVKKPCLAFKIFGAGRKCGTPVVVKERIEYAFKKIKPIDAIVLGMFQKHKNQIKENTDFAREILSGK